MKKALLKQSVTLFGPSGVNTRSTYNYTFLTPIFLAFLPNENSLTRTKIVGYMRGACASDPDLFVVLLGF